MGTVGAGHAFVSLGTSGVLFAANGAYLPNPESAVHTFCHALPDTWHQMGVILSATDALNWLRGVTRQSRRELTGELGDELQGAGRRHLPALSFRRTHAAQRCGDPRLVHRARPCSDRAALTQAVLEGVAFAFRDSLDALRRPAPSSTA